MHPIVNTTKPDPKSLPGFWEPKVIPYLEGSINFKTVDKLTLDEAFVLENVLSKKDCETLIEFMNASDNFEEVGVQGMKEDKDTRIGSLRTSIWSPGVAENIWKKISPYLMKIYGTNWTATDWWQDLSSEELYNPITEYNPIAVSPLLRFMKYEKGGQHYAHYDASFIYPDNNFRSLKSMVVYLTSNNGAATRFINDGQQDIDIWDRKHEDWNREVKPEEIIAKSECIQGNVLIFNHRICHDVEKYLGDEPRVIIRGDIIYEREQ